MVLYDQRSHGRSERAPADSCTIDQLGRDLDAVIRAVAPEGPLVLVSHSMGGMTVMALAEQHPELFHERVAGVALVSTSAGEMASSGLPGTFLSRRNPVIRTLGGLAAWQPGLVETGRRALGDIIWVFTKRFAYGDRQVDPRMVDLVDTMIDSNAVGALTDFVDTLGTHDRLAALPGLSAARCSSWPATATGSSRGGTARSSPRRSRPPGWCACPGSGTCRCWSSPRSSTPSSTR
jgi:pimeloyl-ACP methyl ester carboxylesterase